MNILYKAIAGAMLGVILSLFLSKNNKDFSVTVSLTVCSLIILAAFAYIKPILNFADKLKRLAQLDSEAIQIVMKAVGIGLISDIACLICADAGNEAVSKSIKILSGAVILWLSIPLFESLLELLETILVNL